MPYFNQSETFSTDKAILAFTEGNYFTHSVTVNREFIGLNELDKRTVPEGLFVAEMQDNSVRFLPRTKVTEVGLDTNNDFQIKISPFNIILPGDNLYRIFPFTTIAVNAVTAGQSYGVSINGYRTSSYTATTSDVATTATEIANLINTSYYLKDIVHACVRDSEVTIYGNKVDDTFEVIELAGSTITTTLSDANLTVSNFPVGTVQTTVKKDEFVNFGTSAAVVPVGTCLGTRKEKQILGLHVHSQNFEIATSRDLALVTTSAGVRSHYLPYFDEDIRSRFPKLQFSEKF